MAKAVARMDERNLISLADAFEELAAKLKAPVPRLEVGKFAEACRLFSPLFQLLGITVKHADIELSAKIGVLLRAAESLKTVEDLVDHDIQQNTIKISTSNSRSLIRVKRAMDMLRIAFEQAMARRGNSIVVPISIAYEQVFGPYHGWAIKKAVSASMYTLPTKAQLFKKLNIDEASAYVQMQRIVTALAPVMAYIDNLFHSREASEEVLGLS